MNSLIKIFALVFPIISFIPIKSYTQHAPFHKVWNDPIITERIENGIETHRKGYMTIEVKTKTGVSNEEIEVKLEQISHDFLFGANIFMLGGFDTPEKNKTYETHFCELFNYASVPFYWKDLEPEKGKPRFDVDSNPIYRRPPPDLVVNFCKENNLAMKGHTLIWDNTSWSIPEWWPATEEEMLPLIRKRVDEIAERYGNEIKIWDVANEVTTRNNNVPMPNDFIYFTYKVAENAFPYESTFVLNFADPIWESHFRGEYSADYLLIESLLLRKAKIDAIGIQNHYFNRERYRQMLDGNVMTPQHVFTVLDRYSDFNLPIHITEITFPGLPAGPDGDQNQAVVTENFYKLWFSHPNVEAITWWNLADGTAAPPTKAEDGTIRKGEDQWRGGFLKEDLTPKPAYHVLNELINKKWKTHLNSKTNADGLLTFKGIYGKYRVTITTTEKEIVEEIHLSKSGPKKVELTID